MLQLRNKTFQEIIAVVLGEKAFNKHSHFEYFLYRSMRKTFEVVARGMWTIHITSQNIFFVVASVSIVVITVLFGVVMFRLGRILGRVDRLSEDFSEGLEGLFHFFRDLKRNAVASSLAALISKLIESKTKKGRK